MKILPMTLIALSSLEGLASAQVAKTAVPPPYLPDVKTAPIPYLKEDGTPAQTSTTYRAAPATEVVHPSPAPMFPGIDRERLYHDVDAEGTQWVRGASYKASFGRDGATYIPFFGSRAPRNFPVTFRPAKLTLGGEAQAIGTDVAAARDGTAITFDRGAFLERYHLAPRSIEQTFVFTEPFAGELVLEIAVETELAPVVDADGFRFENDLGHMRYGRAFALDAGGRKAGLEATLDHGTITIRVPESFVAAASFPLVIDPVGSTFTIEAGTIDEFSADTSYDITFGTWLTVCEETFSASDHDIHAVRHSSTGTVTASEYVDFTTTFWARPKIANNNIESLFLVVAQVGSAGSRSIQGRTVDASSSLTLGTVTRYDDPALTGDVLNADVGGDPNLAPPTYFFVIWERVYDSTDRDIHAREITSLGAVNGGTIFIDNSAATVDVDPSISNSDGDVSASYQDWTIVWTRQTATDDDVLGARVHWNGTITDSTFNVGWTTSNEMAGAAAPILTTDPASRRYLVAYQVDGGTEGWNVRFRAFSETTISSTVDSSTFFPSSADLEQIQPSCDTDGQQFVVAYRQNPSVFFSTDIVAATLHLVGGLGVTEGTLSVAPGSYTDSRPEIVSKHASGSTVKDALVVFDRSDAGNLEVLGTLYDIPTGGPKTPYCFGDGSGTACPCGNAGAAGNGCASSVNAAGAHLTWSGSANLAADNLVLRGSGMGATSPCLYFQGTAQTNGGAGTVFGDGLRCASGTVIRLGTKTNSGGASQYPEAGDPDISVRGLVPSAGAERNYQAWYRNSAGFCTSATFNTTNALNVVWVP